MLYAGTAWWWAREDAHEAVDVLFVDEAGQVSLADAIAVAQGAQQLVLLGDPQQLAQVSQGTHPLGAGASVLEHLLGDARHRARTTAASSSTRRGACTPTSAASSPSTMYDGRLSAESHGARRQRIDSPGAVGSRAAHARRRAPRQPQSLAEEAEAIAAQVDALLDGGTCTDRDGDTPRR